MNKKHLLLILALFSILIIGVAPTLAQDIDLVSHMDTYLHDGLPQGWGMVTVDNLVLEMLETPPFLLDVREDAELEELGFIEGAVHIPLRDVAANLDQLPSDLNAPIVVYCKSGYRGALGMTALQVLGYTNVRNLAGGIMGWIGADNPVVTEYVAPEGSNEVPADAELVAFVNDFLQNVLPQGWGIVGSDDLSLELLENPPFLLDVREVAEWDELGHIDGAINIPLREVVANLDQLPDKDTPIVVYCKSGHRGAIGTTVLQMLGYNVRNLGGGIMGWISAGYEVVGGEVAQETATLDFTSYMDTYLHEGLPQGWGMVTVDNLALEMLETPPFLLDVREDAELEELGFIEGAVHIPLREVAANLDLLPSDLDTPIVVYCKSGYRGALGMTALQVLGYTNVRNLAGGIMGWIGADNPVATEYVAPAGGNEVLANAELVTIVDDFLQNVLPQGWGIVKPDDLALQLVENAPFLLDVREVAEWDELGHIDGAINIPLREVVANLDQLPDKDTPIVVYCKSGHRGAIGTTVLQMLGYNVQNLSGGIMGWIAGGYEVVGGMESAAEPVEITLPEGTAIPGDELVASLSSNVEAIANTAGFGTITNETLTEMMDAGVFILDVREDNEWAEGHIPGAVHVPLREVAQNLHLLPDFNTPIVVYCAAGQRGAIGQFALVTLGYTDVTNLRGGFKGWDGSVSTDAAPDTAGAFPEVDADLWTTVDAYLSGLPGFGVISVADFDALMLEGQPVVFDVREAGEYEGGYIAGAINTPTRSFAVFTDQLPADKDAAIVVYGSSGPRGATVMTALQLMGYSDVRNLGGGTAGWQNSGYELTTD